MDATLGPKAYIEDSPTLGRSVLFGGRYINVSHIAEAEHLDLSHLSRVISGRRDPSLPYLKRLAQILGMTPGDVITAIEERRLSLVE